MFERPRVFTIRATSESDYRFDGDVEDGTPSPPESSKPSRADSDAKRSSPYDASSPFSFADLDQDPSFNEFLMGGDPSFQSWGPSPVLDEPSQQGAGRSLGRSPRGRTSFRAASERSRRTRSDSFYGNDGDEYSNYDSPRKQRRRPFGREGEPDLERRSVSQRRQRSDDDGRGDAEQDTPFTYDLSNPDYGNTDDFLQDDIFNFDGPSPARRRDFRQRDDPSRSRNSYDSRRGGRQSNFRSRERHSQPSQGQYQSRRGAVVSADGQKPGRAEGRREEPFSEGYTVFRGHRVYYKIYGSGRETAGKFPILVVHGGPGLPHDYLLPLAKLHSTGRRVIFYDQLGCGKSASDLNADVLKVRQEGGVELFRDELQHIRSELGLWDVHVFAHHWGGCVALEHVLNKPVGQGVVTLCLASTPPSLTSLLHAQHDLVAHLPEHHQRLIQAADPSDPEYALALDEFNRQFLCRCDPWPQCLEDALAKGGVRYRGMEAVGEWTVQDRLGAVDVPTLVCSGEHDHVAPADAEAMAEAIPNAEHILYGSSSHMAHLEEQELFLTTYKYFLTQAEDARRAANWYAFQ